MTLPILACLLGIVLVQQLAQLPSPSQLLALSAIALGLVGWRYRREAIGTFVANRDSNRPVSCYFPSIAALLFGFVWASIFAGWRLDGILADELQGRDIEIQGYVATLPQRQDNRLGFDFVVTQAPPRFPEKIRLSWYYPKVTVNAGQSWALTVKVKRPHGRINPGDFDYEAWLFANGIGATGYVRSKPLPRQIEGAPTVGRYLAVCRRSIAERLDAALADSPQLGIIKALTLGSQDAISRQQWDVYRATGTVHLMVISGSHISLIAGLIYYWTRRGWAWLGPLTMAPQNIAALLSWLAALFYVALAGFTIPTQRALIMLTVALWAIAGQRNIAPLRTLLLALLAVVLFDPLAVLALGFWLSFLAVALLLYISSGRLGHGGFWHEITRAQWAMTIGLSPLSMVFFHQLSLVSPLANWLAVPGIGAVATPMALLGLLLCFVWQPAASVVLWLTDRLLQGLYRLLESMADWPVASIFCLQPPAYALALAAVAVLVLLAPRGLPGRYLGGFLLLPLLIVAADKPKSGEAWLTLLDVGQGLAAVLQTEKHALVFDTGARYSEQADMGESVLLPFLRYSGIDAVDGLVVSHGDNDHSGGAETLLAQMPVTAVYSSVADFAEGHDGRYCRAGQRWQWDGVVFEMLSPFDQPFVGENDNSCVLKVTAAHHSFLLTGDIEQAAENRLVERYGDGLTSSILIAPHHGSKTSSGMGFLQRVKPTWVLIPAGHQNRFGFPHPDVLARYREQGVAWLNSADHGAIEVKTDGDALRIESVRQRQGRYWMALSNESGLSPDRPIKTDQPRSGGE